MMEAIIVKASMTTHGKINITNSEKLLSKTDLEKKLNCVHEQNNFKFWTNEKNKKSESWINFVEIYYKNVKQNFVRCKICKTLLAYKIRTGTAGMPWHKCSNKLGVTITKNVPPININFTRKITEEHKTKLAKLQLNFVTSDIRPFDICSGEGFKALGQELINIGVEYGQQNIDDILVTRRCLTRVVLPEVIKGRKDSIKILLEQYKAISFTCEMWSDNKQKNFLTLTGHALTENFRLLSFVLGTKEFDNIKSGENIISLVINEILQNYVTTAEAETLLMNNIVTDNTANIVKALKHYKRISCMCDNLNIFVEDMTKHFPPEVQDTITAISNVVKYFRQSTLNNKLTKKLKQYISTKWNSLYIMLESYKTMFDEVQNILYEKNELYRLQEVDMTVLTILLDFLKIFKECSERLSSENITTINEVYLWKIKIDKFCQKNPSDPLILKKLKQYVILNFTDTFKVEKIHEVALMLDPNFKNLKFLTKLEKKRIISLLAKMLTDIRNEETIADRNLNDQIPKYTTKKAKLAESLFNEFMDNSDSSEDGNSVGEEIDRYLNEKIRGLPINVLEYWNQSSSYPTLKTLARRILCVPASSAPIERIFSLAERIFCDRRTHINSKHLDELIFMHKNQNICFEAL